MKTGSIGSGRVFRRLLSRLYRWRRHDPRVYRSLSHCEERALCLRTSLRVHRLGEPDFHRMAADERLSADGHQWIDGGVSPRARSFGLETSLRESQSIRLLAWMYYSPSVSCLDRKRARAERFLSPLGISSGSRRDDRGPAGCTMWSRKIRRDEETDRGGVRAAA